MTEELCQFFTPVWVAEQLLERTFASLGRNDLVLEPCCGQGAFLQAVPRHVRAVGVEIDAELARRTELATGRPVLIGDFLGDALQHQLVRGATAVIGNPPFRADFIDGMLKACYALLPEGGRAGFILPAYLFQTAHRVSAYAERWSIAQELLPRNAFHARMQTPLLWAIFTKDRRRELVGFALYREAADVLDMRKEYRELLAGTSGSAWRAVCELALKHLGGEAELPHIYAQLERNRPTRTRFWREKVRQTLRHYRDTFKALDVGRYALVQP